MAGLTSIKDAGGFFVELNGPLKEAPLGIKGSYPCKNVAEAARAHQHSLLFFFNMYLFVWLCRVLAAAQQIFSVAACGIFSWHRESS